MRYPSFPIAALCLGLALLVSTRAPAAPDRQEKEEKATVSGKGKVALTVRNARGRTVVVGRPEARTVTIVATKAAVARDREEATAMLNRLTVDISEGGDEVTVETRDGNKYDDWGWSVMSVVRGNRRSGWVDYTIEVPVAFRVSASTTSGEVRVSNINGRAEVEATSGDVVLRGVGAGTRVELTSGDLEASDIAGDFTISATSGNVTVDNVRGHLKISGTSGDFEVSRVERDVEIDLTSGDFVLEGCRGNVVFRAASGDARMTEVDGSVDASSSSGDITVFIAPVGEREFVFSSSSGDIDISYLPAKNYGFKLDISTHSGSIEGDMPIKVNRVDRRRLQGVVGTGTARVHVETASGDVTIIEKEDAAVKSAR